MHHSCPARPRQTGFTLIELSIVLVIIGLLVGGVLVGNDLIAAAEVRAQIKQIEDIKAATSTFRLKHQGLPGDLKDAVQYGFEPRGAFAGQGDGNRVLEGVSANAASSNSGLIGGSAGETALFWRDLSEAELLQNSFHLANALAPSSSMIKVNHTPGIADFLPEAKLGIGTFVHVWSRDRKNYLAISQVTGLGATPVQALPGFTGNQAYQIDSKIDDGLPDSGVVKAEYVNTNVRWTLGYGYANNKGIIRPEHRFPVAPSATSCFDNNSVNGAAYNYTMTVDGGENINCALSFVLE